MTDYIPRLDEWVRISGQTMEHEMAYLQGLIGDIGKGCVVLEIGTCQGRSTCALALACEVVEGRVWTIDHYKPIESGYVQCDFVEVNKALATLRLTNVTVMQGDSTEMAATWTGPPIDLWFHDGSHFYDKVKADILAWKKHVKLEGFMAFHDYTGESEGQIGVSQAANEVLGKPWYVTSRLGVFHIG